MTPTHHPDQADLMAYAAGTLPEPKALLIATHLAFCPDCRKAVARYEAVGGELLEEVTPEQIDPGRIDTVLGMLDGLSETGANDTPKVKAANTLPPPLADYVPDDLRDIPWKKMGAVEVFEFLPSNRNIKTRLLRIKRGAAMPRHTHDGNEATLVLTGNFSDEFGLYGPGDVCDVDQDVDHQPVAGDEEDCICLALSDASIKLTGTLGRFMNPFVKF